MKIFFLISIATLFMSTSIFAQKMEQKDVPVTIITEFKEMYPEIHTVKWEKEKKDFKATFIKDDIEHIIHFNEKGTRHKTKIRIKEEMLPFNTHNYISTHFPTFKYKEIEKITDKHGIITYKVIINEEEYFFNENGRHIKKK